MAQQVQKYIVQEFIQDKTTDNFVRLMNLTKEQHMVGSVYVAKDMWPKGATGIRFTEYEFTFDTEEEGEN